MDNAAFHKSLKTKEILTEHGHKLEFLPPYSPDFNPIEFKWAQAKSIDVNFIVMFLNFLLPI